MPFRLQTIIDPNEAEQRLCQHWGNIFRPRCDGIPNDQTELALAVVQPATHDLNWTIGLDEFQDHLASKRESAPGPDGLPLSVYGSARGLGAKFLFAAYQAILQGMALSAGFGAGRTVFIPKPGKVNMLKVSFFVHLNPYGR